jgi:hypothetical protein
MITRILAIWPEAKKVLVPYGIDKAGAPTFADEMLRYGFDVTQPYCGLDIPELGCHVYRQPPLPECHEREKRCSQP